MISPCGHVMDFLRKCYRGRIRLFVGAVPRVVPIRWYFTDPDAPIFPFRHCWGSQVYATNYDWDVGDPRELAGFEHASNRNPGFRHQCILGERAWWQSGVIPAAALVSPPPVPRCCYHPEEWFVGEPIGIGRFCIPGWLRPVPHVTPAESIGLGLLLVGGLADAVSGAIALSLDVAGGMAAGLAPVGGLGLTLDVAGGLLGVGALGSPVPLSLDVAGGMAAGLAPVGSLGLTLDVAGGLLGVGALGSPVPLSLDLAGGMAAGLAPVGGLGLTLDVAGGMAAGLAPVGGLGLTLDVAGGMAAGLAPRGALGSPLHLTGGMAAVVSGGSPLRLSFLFGPSLAPAAGRPVAKTLSVGAGIDVPTTMGATVAKTQQLVGACGKGYTGCSVFAGGMAKVWTTAPTGFAGVCSFFNATWTWTLSLGCTAQTLVGAATVTLTITSTTVATITAAAFTYTLTGTFNPYGPNTFTRTSTSCGTGNAPASLTITPA